LKLSDYLRVWLDGIKEGTRKKVEGEVNLLLATARLFGVSFAKLEIWYRRRSLLSK
jgi:hypothetical protein